MLYHRSRTFHDTMIPSYTRGPVSTQLVHPVGLNVLIVETPSPGETILFCTYIRYCTKMHHRSKRPATPHLVQLRRALHVNLERNTDVLSFLSSSALEEMLFPLGETPGHHVPDVTDEALVVYTDDLQLEGAGVLEVVVKIEITRTKTCRPCSWKRVLTMVVQQ